MHDCWQCGKEVDIAERKIGFRALCDHCGSWLHCCENCQNYQPGLPNNCRIPDTEDVADRQAANFCDDFVEKGQKGSQLDKKSISDISESLFGEKEEKSSPSDNAKDGFNALFDD